MDVLVDGQGSARRSSGSARERASRLFSAEATSASILIAEDHTDSRDALRALLEAAGYRVSTASDGDQAVEQALATQPDLILMDVMMPQVDGLEATRRLRRTEGFKQVPILALTAMAGARERVFDAGCDDLIAKPINVTSLFQKVQNWLASGRV